MAKNNDRVIYYTSGYDVERLNREESFDSVFGSGVTEISANAFNKCTVLTKLLNLSKTIELIGESAFKGCIGLTNLPIFPKKLKIIGAQAFCGCANLTGQIIIPKGLKEIKTKAFQNCSGLSEVVIPKKHIKIEDDAFKGCSFQYVTIKKNGKMVLSKEKKQSGRGEVVIELKGRELRAIKRDRNNFPIFYLENKRAMIDIVSKNNETNNACTFDTYKTLKERGLWDDYLIILQRFGQKTKDPAGIEVVSVIDGDLDLAEKFFKSKQTGYDILRKQEWYNDFTDGSKECLMKLFVSLGGFEPSGQNKVLEVIDGLREAYGNNFNMNIVHMFMNTPKGDSHLWGRYGEEPRHCFSKSILNYFVKNKENYNTDDFKNTISTIVSDYPIIYQTYRKHLRNLNPKYKYAAEPDIEKYEKMKNQGITSEFVKDYLKVQRFTYLNNIDLANSLSSLPQGIIVTKEQAKLYEQLLEVEIPKIIESVENGRRKCNKYFVNLIDDGTMVIDDNATGVHYEWAEINRINALTCGELMQTCFRPNYMNRFAYWNCIDNPSDTFMMLYDGSIMLGYCRVRYYPDKKGMLVDNIELSKYAGIHFTTEKRIELAHRCEKGLFDMAKEMNKKGSHVERIYVKQDRWADQTIISEWARTHTIVNKVNNAKPMKEPIYRSPRDFGFYSAEIAGPQIIMYDIAIKKDQKSK